MDEGYLHKAMRYVEFNPVKAGLVEKPGGYPWSSARAHLEGEADDWAESSLYMIGDLDEARCKEASAKARRG